MGLNYGRPLASVLAVVAVVAFVLVGSANSNRLFMNGSLSLTHQGLESKCDFCHEAWEGVQEKSCWKCHGSKEHLSKEKTLRTGHVKFEKKSCPECHKEHKGRSNDLALGGEGECADCHLSREHVKAPPGRSVVGDARLIFTHQNHIGYGAYKKEDCGTCHKTESAQSGFTSQGAYKNACGSCHYLRKHDASIKFGKKCGICHPAGGIKAPKITKEKSLKSFMYSHIDHQGVKCLDCHENIVTGKSDYQSINVNKCVDCHKNRFINSSCVGCHQYHAKPEA